MQCFINTLYINTHITLTYSQESVYPHLNVIFNVGARCTQCGALRTRKAWVLRP